MARMRVVVLPEYMQALESAQDFLFDAGAVAAAERLSDAALVRVAERLEAFPRIGRDFMARTPTTEQAHVLWTMLQDALGSGIELRELLVGDYLVLYAIGEEFLYLLTLRHHRQDGFNFSKE